MTKDNWRDILFTMSRPPRIAIIVYSMHDHIAKCRSSATANLILNSDKGSGRGWKRGYRSSRRKSNHLSVSKISQPWYRQGSMLLTTEFGKRFQKKYWRKCMLLIIGWQMDILLPHSIRLRPMTLSSSVFQLDMVTCLLSSRCHWIVIFAWAVLITIVCHRHSGIKLENYGVRVHLQENLRGSLSPQVV